MNTRTFVSAVLATTIGLGAIPSFAQGNSQRANNREEILRQLRQDDRRDDRQDARHDQKHPHPYYDARGPEFR